MNKFEVFVLGCMIATAVICLLFKCTARDWFKAWFTKQEASLADKVLKK